MIVSDKGVSLSKYLADCGICSRRKAVELVKQGLVSVSGDIIMQPGVRVLQNDNVKFDGKIILPEKKVYILLNKPKDYITTVSDEQGRRTVVDIIKEHVRERVVPVGRLDRNTTGLLFLTNDGDLSLQLAHPRYEVKKIYHVRLSEFFHRKDFIQLKKGISLDDGLLRVDNLYYCDDTKKNLIGVEIHSGRNRIVRRMFEYFGYKVINLDRVEYAGITKNGLLQGRWRFLSSMEVAKLKK